MNAASFLFVIAALWAMRSPTPAELGVVPGGPAPEPSGRGGASAREGSLKTLLAGIQYARQNTAVGLLILSTAVLTIFGFPYMTLLPAIVNRTLGLAEGGAAYKHAVALHHGGERPRCDGRSAGGGEPPARREAQPPDPVHTPRVRRSARGLRTLAIGCGDRWRSRRLAGAALMTTNSLANTSIQSAVPAHLRGRVMALFVMSFIGIMPISGLVFGALGQVIGPSNAVLVGCDRSRHVGAAAGRSTIYDHAEASLPKSRPPVSPDGLRTRRHANRAASPRGDSDGQDRRPSRSRTCRPRSELSVSPVYPKRLEEHYGDPHAGTATSTNPYQLLIAVILSAQTTDVGVNKATPALFERYPDCVRSPPRTSSRSRRYVQDARLLPPEDARTSSRAARCIVAEFGGEVPDTMEELTALARRRAQDREHRARRGVRQGRGHRGRHPRLPSRTSTSGSPSDRPRQGRARPDAESSRETTGIG